MEKRCFRKMQCNCTFLMEILHGDFLLKYIQSFFLFIFLTELLRKLVVKGTVQTLSNCLVFWGFFVRLLLRKFKTDCILAAVCHMPVCSLQMYARQADIKKD